MNASKRDSWNTYFMKIALLVATRSTCLRRDVGCVVVKDSHILTTGYNGVPHKFKHCTEETCIRITNKIPSGSRPDLCNAIHAEENAIIQASTNSIDISNSIMYLTTHPCASCARMLIQAKVSKIFYLGDYNDTTAYQILSLAEIPIIKLDLWR